MPHAIMVSGSYPCVRCSKLTEAIESWTHEVVCRMYPPQIPDAYTRISALKGASRKELSEFVKRTPGEMIHVHNEPNWPAVTIKEIDDRPLIFDVHDVSSARPAKPDDPNLMLEREAYEAADGFVFVSTQQRDFCISKGFDVLGKPYAVMPNYASHTTITPKRPLLPHLGGVVYAGGLDPRGLENSWRDLSPVADMLGESFHVYPGGPGADYGNLHPTVYDYRLLTHRLAQHDWGFSGTPVPNDAWGHSYPNKVFEYFAAGIPLIALNNPLLAEFCDMGLGVYLPEMGAIGAAAKLDPRPYRKRVLQMRERFTMRYNIQPVLDLYEEVLNGHGRHIELQPVGLPQAGDNLGSVRDAIGIRL